MPFFLLTAAIALPFWLLGALTGLEPLPGLPVAALMTVCPMLAAAMLVYRANGTPGVIALLTRSIDFKRIGAKAWYAPILLLSPVVGVVSFVVLRLTGTPVPAPTIAVLPALILGVVFFIAALGEELGWSGYAPL